MAIHPRRSHLKWLALLSAIGVLTIHAGPPLMVVLGDSRHAGVGIPADWQLKEKIGKAQVAGCEENEGSCIHLTSQNSSFSLERSVAVDPAALPYLSWDWKVTRLPANGDVRKPSTDDQAAQLLVAFSDRRVLSYIWDSNAPKGTTQSGGVIPLIRIVAVVCESGAGETNRWVTETRNVAADYVRTFGKPAPQIKGLRLQINTQHTGSQAESYFGRVTFRSAAE